MKNTAEQTEYKIINRRHKNDVEYEIGQYRVHVTKKDAFHRIPDNQPVMAEYQTVVRIVVTRDWGHTIVSEVERCFSRAQPESEDADTRTKRLRAWIDADVDRFISQHLHAVAQR